MDYKNKAIIFIAGVICGVIGGWLVGMLLTPTPSVSDVQLAASADTPLTSSPSQGEHPTDQTAATPNLTLQSVPTPTRTQLIAYQMALRSGREMSSTEKFYRIMLPHAVRICDDVEGMSDAANMLIHTHERILDLGLRYPDDLVDVSYNLYSVMVEAESRLRQSTDDSPCAVLADVYVELRRQGLSKEAATHTMLGAIRGN